MIDILKELLIFLVQKKKYWLIPLIFIIVLMGLLFVAGQGTTLSPFIYTIF
tara:strand:+ start:1098 stop:1250 length:153 start_codon:yes stop_codon:yes gene_type:complete